ncbi:Protein translation factor SUI1-like protein [Zea mays]|uniref:Protein translation factor SUI1-like protein n=1 Tax=Zea mays TaxID=4577 RepID=A0A1D6F8V8_MAIZE|nr:Protein translation factor SUI1-like protein [Zea mays]
MEQRAKGLRVWRDTNRLASRLYNFKRDTEPLVSLSEEQSNDLTDGDKNQEANCSNVDDMYHGLTVNSEIDSLPDPKDQGLNKEFSYNKNLIDLKKEFCCNGTVVQDPELGPAIQLQSDQRKNGLM